MEVDVMKIAVITGASSGLGREFARQINQHFVTLDEIWLIARREERLNELKESLHGVHVRTIPVDLCDRDAVGTYEEMLQKFHPQIRVLINAAGYGKMGYVEQISEEDLAGEIRLNCEALTRMTKISLPYMAKRSNIINIASSAAFMPQPNFAVYAASKSYVLSFSRALHQELKKQGIVVTAVCPGPVNTEFFDIAESYTKTKGYKVILRANAGKVVTLAIKDAMKGKTVSTYGGIMKAFRVVTKIVPHGFIIPFIH